MYFEKISQTEREQLYQEVWAYPIMVVAQKHNMSENSFRRYCKKLWIPIPRADYWAKLEAGKPTVKLELPKVGGELKKYIHGYVIKYRTDIEQLPDNDLLNSETLCMLTDETVAVIKEASTRIKVKGQLQNPHSLIVQHKEEINLRKQRKKSIESKRETKAILPINVSGSNLNRSYKILNSIICTLDDLEGKTGVCPDQDKDRGYFWVLHTPIFFEIREDVSSKKNTNDESTKKLVLTLYSDDWYHTNFKFDKEYSDRDGELLEDQTGKILFDIFYFANRSEVQEELNKRKEKREKEEKLRQERLELMRKGELDEIKVLQQAASDWDQAQKIRAFIDVMQSKVNQIEDEQKRKEVCNWIKWALDKADWLDPLIEKDDELLGRSEHIFNKIL